MYYHYEVIQEIIQIIHNPWDLLNLENEVITCSYQLRHICKFSTDDKQFEPWLNLLKLSCILFLFGFF